MSLPNQGFLYYPFIYPQTLHPLNFPIYLFGQQETSSYPLAINFLSQGHECPELGVLRAENEAITRENTELRAVAA